MGVNVRSVLETIGVDYEVSGDRFMVCCPFHNDRNPSCGLWVDSGYFKCFGCGEEGSLVDFVVKAEGVPRHQAIRLVKGQTSLSDLEDSIGRMLDEKEKPFKYFKWKSFASVYPKVIPDTRAWDYLESRNLTADTIRRFRIRWGGDTGKYHHRVVVPIFTPDQKLIAYVGRAIFNDMVPKTRKNRSPHRTLFGLKELLEVTPNPKYLVVVEGEFDAMYLQQFGVPAVANMGTLPFSPEKIRQARNYASGLVFSYDGDAAGGKAMFGDADKGKVGQISVLSRYIPTYCVELPEGTDPNELSEKQVFTLYSKYL